MFATTPASLSTPVHFGTLSDKTCPGSVASTRTGSPGGSSSASSHDSLVSQHGWPGNDFTKRHIGEEVGALASRRGILALSELAIDTDNESVEAPLSCSDAVGSTPSWAQICGAVPRCTPFTPQMTSFSPPNRSVGSDVSQASLGPSPVANQIPTQNIMRTSPAHQSGDASQRTPNRRSPLGAAAASGDASARNAIGRPPLGAGVLGGDASQRSPPGQASRTGVANQRSRAGQASRMIELGLARTGCTSTAHVGNRSGGKAMSSPSMCLGATTPAASQQPVMQDASMRKPDVSPQGVQKPGMPDASMRRPGMSPQAWQKPVMQESPHMNSTSDSSEALKVVQESPHTDSTSDSSAALKAWLSGNHAPLCAQELAQRLRVAAPECYED